MRPFLAAIIAITTLAVGVTAADARMHHQHRHKVKVCSMHHHHRVCQWVWR